MVPAHHVERWCNQVAAELLVPMEVLRQEIGSRVDLQADINRLARRFKVSTLVILRRIYDAGAVSREVFWRTYDAEVERLRAMPTGTGGNFYLSVPVRVSRRFARALVGSTLEGQTLYRDALRMLEQNGPMVLLADIAMPHMDGLALIRAVRALDPPLSTIPAAALTAFGADEYLGPATSAGFQTLLEKPVRADALTRQVAALLRQSGWGESH